MGFNARPAAQSLSIALCAEAVVAIAIIAALFVVVLGIWP